MTPPKSYPHQIIDKNGQIIHQGKSGLEKFYDDTMNYLFATYHDHAPENQDYALSDDDRMQQDFAGLEG